MNFNNENNSLLFQRLYLTKHSFICNIEFYQFTLTNLDRKIKSLRFQLEYKRVVKKIKINQPNFMFIPTSIQLSTFKQIFFSMTLFTKATIILMDTSNNKIYYVCITCAQLISQTFATKNSYEKFIFHPKVFNIPRQVRTIKQMQNIVNKYAFMTAEFVQSEDCPFETQQERNYYWIICIKELMTQKLNCTSKLCLTELNFGFGLMPQDSFEKPYFWNAHGSEFQGIRNLVFYVSTKSRNWFALLSPFSVVDWVAILTSICLVGVTLWLSKFKCNPFFWLFDVILEQNDDKRSKLNRVSVALVMVWLYVAHVLRNAYTSNMYSYMTLEQNPSDLPNSFDEITKDNDVVLLSSPTSMRILRQYKIAVDNGKFVNNSRLYSLADSAFKKLFKMKFHSNDSTLANIQSPSYRKSRICNVNFLNEIDEQSCVVINRFSYMTISFSSELWYTLKEENYFGKLLLKSSSPDLEIHSIYEKEWFQSGLFFYSETDNIYKLKFENYLSFIYEAGITILQLEYTIKLGLKQILMNYQKDHSSYETEVTKCSIKCNVSRESLLINNIHWLHNKCYTFYAKTKCELNFFKNPEVPVSIVDILVVWILFIGLITMTVFVFVYENVGIRFNFLIK